MISKIICRNCKKKKVQRIFDLGKLYFTGKFPLTLSSKLKKDILGLDFCNNCKLVQLSKSYSAKYLFSKDYGYKTGINQTMRSHMKKVRNVLYKKISLIKGDYVLDIASNDGTLLNLYNMKINKVGIDPILNRYKNEYKHISDNYNIYGYS